MSYIKLDNGVVVQKQLVPSNGFIKAPDYVVCGMVDNGDGSYSAPEKPLDELKEQKITELRLACRAHIFAGFDSDALGMTHRYPLSDTDQANNQKTEVSAMKNVDTVGWTGVMQCINSAGVKAYRPHTAAQVDQAAADIETGKEAALLKLQDLIVQVNAADTQAKLDVIVW